MAELVPSIIAKDFSDFEQKCSFLRGRVASAHLDVVDGKFAPNVSWGDPRALREFDAGIAIEAHLMIANPQQCIADWVQARVQRIFYHYESTAAHEAIITACKQGNVEVGIALLPETSENVVDVLKEYAGRIDAVLLLGVNPGFYGSPFHEHVMENISALRKNYQNLTIEVDGGMNPQRARQAIDAGANDIVSGSYIFESDDPKRAIEEMKRAISELSS